MQNGSPALHPWQLVCAMLIGILALGLRLHALTQSALSNDELGTMETAAGRGQIHLTLPRNVILTPPPVITSLQGAAPLWDVPMRMQSDVHPPLYFIALRLWQDIFGGGDGKSRAMSAIAGAAAVVVLFDVGRLLDTPASGLWAALMMALAQWQISSSQEARPYSLALFFLIAAADALLRIHRLGLTRRRAIALGVFTAAACLTHYFVLPAVVAMGIYALIKLPRGDRRNTILVLILAGVFVLAAWGPGLWSQRKNFADPWMYWMTDLSPHHAIATLQRAAGLPLRFLADPYGGPEITSIAAVIYLLPWLLLRRMPQMLLPAMWLLGCVGMITALDLYRGTLQLMWVKYTIMGAPALYLILAMLGSAFRYGQLIPAAIVLFCLQGFHQAYEGAGYNSRHFSDYRNLAADVDRLSEPGEPLLFAGSGWGEWYTADLYMGFQRYPTHMPPSIALLQYPVPPELLAELQHRAAGGRHLLLVAWTNHPPDQLLPGWHADSVINYAFAAKLFEMSPPSSD